MSEQKDSGIERLRSELELADGIQDIEELTLAAINKKIEKVLEEAKVSLPPEERKRVGMVVEQVFEKSQFFSGPQPSPELLEKYEHICPGSAEKLLQMGFSEQQQRHAWEKRMLDQKDRVIELDHRDATYAMTGLILGFLALLVILGVGVYALSSGHVEVAIGCLGGGFIAAVASVFVNGRSRKPHIANNAKIEDDSAAKA